MPNATPSSTDHIVPILSIAMVLMVAVIMVSIRSTESFVSYTKCATSTSRAQHVTGLVKDIFEAHGVTHTTVPLHAWDVYLPCNYTGVEKELKTGSVRCDRSTQAVYAVDGCDKLVAKNALWTLLEQRYGRRIASTLVPDTYVLRNEAHMSQFMREYRADAWYILKKNVQRKEGLLLTRSLEAVLRGSALDYVVVQRYLRDVHLVEKHKLNLRLYVAIVCDPRGRKHAYLHREGKCMYTAKPYQPQSVDFEHQITSVNLDPKIYDQLPLTLAELRVYWQARGIQYTNVHRRIVALLQLVARAMLPHVCRNRRVCPHNTRFQLFGVDIVLTDRLEPFLLELNKGPAMTPVNENDRRVKRMVLEDIFALAGVLPPTVNRQQGFARLTSM